MSLRTLLLIIDAQIDFCDPKGALYVPGAKEDMTRLVDLVCNTIEKIDEVIVTLDTHLINDISHPVFWFDHSGRNPAPFTAITLEDVTKGRWTPSREKDWVISYLKQLEEQQEFTHFIWPEHCIQGSRGNALYPALGDMLAQRARMTGKDHISIVKGLNPLTEHFGVFAAQVPRPEDPYTGLNTWLIDKLGKFDRILIAGEARSHCVATSVKQILKFAPHLTPRITLLTDCMSDVAGMGQLADPIFAEAAAGGMKFLESTEAL